LFDHAGAMIRSWHVPNAHFTPTGLPIVPISGFDDPKLVRALQRLHRERYESRLKEGLPAIAPPPLPACTPQLFQDTIKHFALTVDLLPPTDPEARARYPRALYDFRALTMYVPQADHPEPAPMGGGSSETVAIEVEDAKRLLDELVRLGFFKEPALGDQPYRPPQARLTLSTTLEDGRLVQCWMVLPWDEQLYGKLLRLQAAAKGDPEAAMNRLISPLTTKGD
jgi:hypothetical protein